MSADPPESIDPTDPHEALRRVNRGLRERVAELERRLARFDAGVAAPLGATEPEREVLQAEAERVAHMGTWVWDVVAGDVRWSDELYRILGYDPGVDAASSEAFFARVHPDDQARVRATSDRGIATGVAEQVEYRVLRPDGSVRHVIMDGAFLFDAAGRLQRAVGTVLDHTEARETAHQLRRTADLLAHAQRIANVGSFEVEVGTEQLYWSAQLFPILDVDVGQRPAIATFLDRIHPDDRPMVAGVVDRALASGATEPTRARVIHRDGSVRHVDMAGVAVHDAGGRLVAIRGTITDVTELVRLEARFHHSQKMEAIGLLAGGLAHDFNNLLAIILGNVELELAARPSAELREAVTATVAARDLTSRLLTLGRQSLPHTRTLRLADALIDIAPLLRRAAGDLVTVHVDADDRWPVRGDAAQLQQVLINLALNARDAMPDGGTLTVTTRHRRLAAVDAARHRVEPGDHVVLEVTDTGVGMDEATLGRAFEPFFTSKPDGRGSGLGLAMVFGAMRQTRGFVEVTSRPGEGATFSLWFPRAADEAVAPAPGRPAPVVARARVLLVEDDPAVAKVARRILVSAGYPVREAASGPAALAAWAAEPAEVLVTDVRMPGMSGVALAEQLRARAPGLPTLFVTGHSTEDIELSDRAAPSLFLMKPFTRDELLGALARLLAPAAP